MEKLTPCTNCRRHVRAHERRCPSCNASRVTTVTRSLAAGAGILTIATLGIGWDADAGTAEPDASTDSGASVLKDTGDRYVVPVYGLAPSHRRGC